MPACCHPGHASDASSECPTCPRSGTPGQRVGLDTVKVMLTEAALARLSDGDYRFCPDPDCQVVYFTHETTYGVTDVRVSVWQKERPGDRTICYCFGETEARIERELKVQSKCQAVERVRAHIEAGRCACEWRNPRGVCCLSDIIAAVKRIGDARGLSNR